MASVDFRGLRPRSRLVKTVALGRGGAETYCACVGFGAIRAGGFLPVTAAGSCKTVASAYFRGCGVCTQYDPKVVLGARTLNPKDDAYYGS